MAGITLEQAQARLDDYLAAEEAVLAGQQYTIGTRTLRRADLGIIQAGISAWNARVSELAQRANGRGRARTVRPAF